jgi:hypothetical protein
MLKGKPDMEALNMIAEAGVPIFTEMADSMGISREQLFALSKQGKLTTSDLTKTFEKMTSEGGIFFRGMEIASKTTTGLFSTLKDNISLTAAELGSVLAPTVKDLIKSITSVAQKSREWVKENREVINEKFLVFIENAKVGIAGFVSFITKMWEHRKTIGVIVGVIATLVIALKSLVAILTVVNLVMSANPIGLIIIGVAALVGVILFLGKVLGTVLGDNWDKIVGGFMRGIRAIKAGLLSVGKFFGFVNEEDDGGNIPQIVRQQDRIASAPEIASPHDRVARSIQERRTTEKSEITLRTDPGTSAEVTGGSLGGLELIQSGAF